MALRPITRIVVHCSASPDAQDIGFKEINQFHLSKGWQGPSGIGCGYHFLIRRNGTIELGRGVEEKGAHVKGANFDSIGICLIGTHEFTESQFKSLKRLIASLKEQFGNLTIHEHREFPSAIDQGKTCPNFNVHAVLGI